MDVLEFCKGIELPEEATCIIQEMGVSEDEYREGRLLYEKDHETFFGYILRKPKPYSLFLAYYCRFACDTYLCFQKQGIEEQIFWDTFRDIRHWCENCKTEYGEYGIRQYDWFWRHFDMTIFKLGRLEYESMKAEHDIGAHGCFVKAEQPVINIHIPQGESLKPEACRESLQQAMQWFGSEKPYICHSWLLYPKLDQILSAESNIIRFQNLFDIVETEDKEREAEWRIFTKVQEDYEKYPEKTSLQKKAKEYLKQGNPIGVGIGMLKKRELL